MGEGFGLANCTHKSADARRECKDMRRVCPQQELEREWDENAALYNTTLVKV